MNDLNAIQIFFSVIFYFCSVLVVICHTKSMLTNPGIVEFGWKPSQKERNINLSDQNISNTHLFCKKCNNHRPTRSHHCKKCGKCILKMDHHCPWIANCVGFYNQKYFFQFVFYATLGDLIAFVLLGIKLMNADFKVKQRKVESSLDLIFVMWEPLMISISTILALAMTFAIGLLFFIQLRLILINHTSIECRIFDDYKMSPFYYEDKLHNFKIVMGDSFINWIFPTKFKPNLFNYGYSWKTPRDIPPIMLEETPRYVELVEGESIEANPVVFNNSSYIDKNNNDK
jgi:palmitoyltransferase